MLSRKPKKRDHDDVEDEDGDEDGEAKSSRVGDRMGIKEQMEDELVDIERKNVMLVFLQRMTRWMLLYSVMIVIIKNLWSPILKLKMSESLPKRDLL